MARSVDVVGWAIEVTIFWFGREVEGGGRLCRCTIEHHLGHRTVLVIVVDKSLEELVSHTTLDFVSTSGGGLLVEHVHLGLDHEVVARPFLSPSSFILIADDAVGVVLNLLSIWLDTA